MMNRNCHIIYNPYAAGGRYLLQIQDIVHQLAQNHIHAELHKTQYPQHADEIAQQIQEEETTTIISAGGDGTAAEVMNGIMKNPCKEHIQMGILPLGTGNDFIKDFRVYTVDHALERIVKGNVKRIDIGKVTIQKPEEKEPFYFMNMLGTGIIAEGARLRRDVYSWAGRWGYHFAFFHLLMQLKTLPTSILIDNKHSIYPKSPILGVCNSQYTGHGMRLSPKSNTHDGKFDLIYADELGVWELLKMFIGLPAGKHLDHPHIHQYTAETIELEWKGLDQFMVDGEILDGTKIKIEMLPQALSILI